MASSKKLFEVPGEVLKIAEDIKTMRIRGAGNIARNAARALAIAASKYAYREGSVEDFIRYIEHVGRVLVNTRPTAVSLPNAVSLTLKPIKTGRFSSVEEAVRAVVDAAERFISYSKEAIEKIAEFGARIVEDGSVILTHCNSSAAASIMIRAHESGKDIQVIATETRPKYQGYITARVLASNGVRVRMITDTGIYTALRNVDLVIVGADTITSNGALINKVGTSQIALIAKNMSIPFIVAAETYKFSPRTYFGEYVLIEERDASEVVEKPPMGVRVWNPAFDATPPEYIDAIVTEIGIIPPRSASIIIKDYLGHEIGEAISVINFDESEPI